MSSDKIKSHDDLFYALLQDRDKWRSVADEMAKALEFRGMDFEGLIWKALELYRKAKGEEK